MELVARVSGLPPLKIYHMVLAKTIFIEVNVPGDEKRRHILGTGRGVAARYSL